MRRDLGMRSIFRCFQAVGSTAEEVPPLFLFNHILLKTERVYAGTDVVLVSRLYLHFKVILNPVGTG